MKDLCPTSYIKFKDFPASHVYRRVNKHKILSVFPQYWISINKLALYCDILKQQLASRPKKAMFNDQIH